MLSIFGVRNLSPEIEVERVWDQRQVYFLSYSDVKWRQLDKRRSKLAVVYTTASAARPRTSRQTSTDAPPPGQHTRTHHHTCSSSIIPSTCTVSQNWVKLVSSCWPANESMMRHDHAIHFFANSSVSKRGRQSGSTYAHPSGQFAVSREDESGV